MLLDRVAELLQLGTMLWFRGGDGAEMLALARLACEVPDEIDDAPVFAAIRSAARRLRQGADRRPGGPPPPDLPDAGVRGCPNTDVPVPAVS